MKIEQIIKKRERYLEEQNLTDFKENAKRRDRLKTLVEKFGIESVSAATGLTVKTLTQYCRVKYPPPINEKTIVMAETILN